MKRKILLLVCLVAATFSVAAQGSIRGNIKTLQIHEGEEKIEPLTNAEVYVMYGGSIIRAHTNNHGDYTLRPLEPGTYNVTISSIFIDTVTIPGVVVSGTGMAMVQDMVVPLGRSMTPVVIRPNETIRDESPSKGELKHGELSKLPDPGNINHAVELFGGAWVSDNGRQISFRGARIGDAAYYVDGVRQRGTDVSVPRGAIATLNVWNGGVPAQYGDFMGGVVAIETMSYFDWLNQQEVKRLIAKKHEDEERFRQALDKHAPKASINQENIHEEIQEEE